MKATFPLSLKFTLWLLLNLALLAAFALAVIVAQGGFGSDTLVRGPAGRHLQELGTALATELSAATTASARSEILDRYGAAHGAKFYVFHPLLPEAAPLGRELPPEVMQRVDERPPARGGLPGGREGGPPRGRAGRPPDGPPDISPAAPPPTQSRRPIDELRGRFLVHTTAPAAYWLGVRAPLGPRPFASPGAIVVRVDSLWGLLRLLELQPWLLAAATIVVFSVLFWLPFVRGITRDLGRLTAATGEIAEGRFDTRVATARRDELGSLGESVNGMAARLDTLVNGQKRFLGDVAHELGSPLARLQVATEILESRADPALRPQIADVREEVQQMAALVNELLAFTKAGMRPRETALAEVNLAELVAAVLAREDGAGRVRLDLAPDLHVRADFALLARALGNLVRNALRYAADAGPIVVRAQRESSTVVLAVEDEGSGVPAGALARLGEPFYRPESARTRETGGVGLGLAIVRSSVAACGGEVHFANRTPRGFRAELRLSAA